MNKVWLIFWGYYNCRHNDDQVLQSFHSTYERALDSLHSSTQHIRDLEQKKHRTTGELLDTWSDGDYWISISEGYIDRDYWHLDE